MMKKTASLLLTLFLVVLTTGVQCQYSVRLVKPQQAFFFGGINVQSKYLNASTGREKGIELSNGGTANQLLFQYLWKNGGVIQKGYIHKISLSSIQTIFAIEPDIAGMGRITPDAITRLRFRLMCVVNFSTKWERLVFSIGSRALPWGHHPSVDPFFTFHPSQAQVDFGYNNDMGFFIRMPLRVNRDFEAGLSAGGFLKSPPLMTRQLHPADNSGAALFQLSHESYGPTALLTSRWGTPPFKNQEFGLSGALGRIVDPFHATGQAWICRMGLDYTKKIRDGFRVTQQLSFGPYINKEGSADNAFFTWNAHTQVEALLLKRILLACTHSGWQRLDGGTHQYTGNVYGTVGFVIDPNLQLRINTAYNYFHDGVRTHDMGLYAQLFAGIGQR
jgi:hypothetical protein